MKIDEFLARVAERGEHADHAEAERVTRGTLTVLGERLDGGEAKDLAAQLPGDLQDVLLTAPQPAMSLGVEDFLSRVAAVLGTSAETARWDVSAVLSTVADAVSDGELTDVLSQLPRGFPELFGRPELEG